MKGLKKVTIGSINGINLFVIPSAFALMLFALPVVNLLFGRGSFDSAALKMTSDALIFYSAGLAAMGMSEILSRAFYSMKDIKTPLFISALAIGANICLNALLSGPMGIGGLALATSLSLVLRTALLFWMLRKKTGVLDAGSLAVSSLKILCASIAAGFCARFIYFSLTGDGMNESIPLLLSALAGALVYFALIYFMKVNDVRAIIGGLKRRLLKTV